MRADVRELLAGNICRCTGYQLIVDAASCRARGRDDEHGATFAHATRRGASRCAPSIPTGWCSPAAPTSWSTRTHHAAPPASSICGGAWLHAITRAADGIAIGAARRGSRSSATAIIPRRMHRSPPPRARSARCRSRSRATLGGNVGTSSPVGDSLPVLLALDAELELSLSVRGVHRVAYRALLHRAIARRCSRPTS